MVRIFFVISWWRHQMETFSALLAICARNSPVPGEFPAQRPVTRSFDFFFDLRLNKRLSKQSRGWWFETLPSPLWRHSNVAIYDNNASNVFWTFGLGWLSNIPSIFNDSNCPLLIVLCMLHISVCKYYVDTCYLSISHSSNYLIKYGICIYTLPY